MGSASPAPFAFLPLNSEHSHVPVYAHDEMACRCGTAVVRCGARRSVRRAQCRWGRVSSARVRTQTTQLEDAKFFWPRNESRNCNVQTKGRGKPETRRVRSASPDPRPKAKRTKLERRRIHYRKSCVSSSTGKTTKHQRLRLVGDDVARIPYPTRYGPADSQSSQSSQDKSRHTRDMWTCSWGSTHTLQLLLQPARRGGRGGARREGQEVIQVASHRAARIPRRDT